MKRREFVTLLGGAAAAWPLAAKAQQARVRRLGALLGIAENDPETKSRLAAFRQGLRDLGWIEGRNISIDYRFGSADDVNRTGALAQEVVGLQPDIILTAGTPATVAVQRETRTIPIVFANVADPVASGLVAHLNRPSGNITGFANFEATLGGKWLELLSEIAPGLKRAAIIFNPDTAPVSTYMPSFEAAARLLKIVPIPAPVRNDVEIDAAIIAFVREPGGGIVVMPGTFTNTRRALIAAMARNNLPAVYGFSYFVRDGGLLSYGPDSVDIFRRSATYVDRILRGAKPAELPVQFPTKFEMVVNLKTAKALGLTIPETFLVRADEVIE
jgi:putative ABC transport system substrate-binding protein